MLKTHLRRVGGSVMLAVPARVLELLHLEAGATVELRVDQGRLVVEPSLRPRYTLEELLGQCDPSVPLSGDEQEWLEGPAVGTELL